MDLLVVGLGLLVQWAVVATAVYYGVHEALERYFGESPPDLGDLTDASVGSE